MKTGINRHLWTLAKNPYLCPFWSPEPGAKVRILLGAPKDS